MLDPWENIRSINTEIIQKNAANFIKPVCEYYKIPKKKYCMVLGPVSHCNIISSHIWPHHTNGSGLPALGLNLEDVNSPRNFLRLHKSIERAFDHKRLYFECSNCGNRANSTTLRVILVDPSLAAEAFHVNGKRRTFSEIDNMEFHYKFSQTEERKPFTRLIALHACRTISKARNLNWISDDADAEERRNRSLELARLSLQDRSDVLNAFFTPSTI